MTRPGWRPRRTACAQDTLAIIMAGGSGTRLGDLTRWRAKPALPFGGKYRSIDFPLSNCLNSGIRRIGVLTQYKAHTLIQHLQRGWQFLDPALGEFIEVWPAQQRTGTDWYQGTADAVYQNIDIIKDQAPKYTLILAGDHIYTMDYEQMLQRHAESGAEVTVAALEVPKATAGEFGVIATDRSGRVIVFEEKPKCATGSSHDPDTVLASMGIYVFATDTLVAKLIEDAASTTSSHDFGRDILPSMVSTGRVMTHKLLDERGNRGFWYDIGTLDAYWEASMHVLQPRHGLVLCDAGWPIRTFEAQYPPARFASSGTNRNAQTIDALVSNGCVISDSTITRSILSNNVTVGPGCEIVDSVILPDVTIGSGCRIQRAIIDNDCCIPEGSVIGYNAQADALRFAVTRKGVVLVTAAMLETKVAIDRQSRVTRGLSKIDLEHLTAGLRLNVARPYMLGHAENTQRPDLPVDRGVVSSDL